MRKISILGCGWLGKPLGLELINLNFIVKGSTTTQEKLQEFSQLGIEPFLINLDEIDTVYKEFLNSEIVIVSLTSKNINGFENLITQIENSSIKKVIFISSTSVYPNNNQIVSEDATLVSSPLVEIESLFTNNFNFQTTIVRFAGLFGYNRKPGNFFSNGRLIPNPDGFVNMIHRDDCISILTEIIKKEVWGEVLNACADTHPKRRDYYTKTKADIGNELPTFIESASTEFKIIANKKLKSILNYKFKYGNLMEIDYNSPFI
jgi:nucleoside-diphosphate-sugar epimerase